MIRRAIQAKAALFYGLYLVVAFVFWRVRYIDIPSLITMHQHPFVLGSEASFLHGSPLGPLIGYFLHVEGKWPVHLFYSIFVAITLVAIFFFVRSIAKKDQHKTFLLLAVLSLSPLFHVLYSWIGKSDALLVLAYLAFVASSTLVLESGAAFFLLLAHREQALVILALHLWLFPTEWRKLLRALPGSFSDWRGFICIRYLLGITPIVSHFLFRITVFLCASTGFCWSQSSR
jgi:hypothetical protein